MEITAQQYISNEKDSHSYVTTYVNLFSSRNEKSGKEGDIYVILKMSSSKKLPLQRLSKFVLDSLTDGYLYSHEKTTNESMKSALADGFNKLRTLIQSDKDIDGSKIDLTILICLVKKDGLYIGSIGNGEILVIKGGKAVDIAGIMKKKEANTAGVLLEENEALLLSTQEILSKSLSDIIVASEQGKIEREITRIGVNMTGDSALMSFLNKKKEIMPSMLEKKIESIEAISEIEETFIPNEEIEQEKPQKTERKFLLQFKKLKGNHTVGQIGETFKQTAGKVSSFGLKLKPSKETIEKAGNIWGKVKILLKKLLNLVKTLFGINLPSDVT